MGDLQWGAEKVGGSRHPERRFPYRANNFNTPIPAALAGDLLSFFSRHLKNTTLVSGQVVNNGTLNLIIEKCMTRYAPIRPLIKQGSYCASLSCIFGGLGRGTKTVLKVSTTT
jgi:hypothetical protein